LDRDKALLYELILSPSQWDRRIALVSTWPLIQAGKINDTLKLAALVLGDEADLIHKAAGWMLREVGKKDVAALRNFLEKHRADMPRTMLRYAIERFTPAERARWLKRA
jgi:3-methyladenine DNA glycosylase AlkD